MYDAINDGPSIFIAEEVNTVGLFYKHQSKIPPCICSEIMDKIQKKMDQLSKSLKDAMGKDIFLYKSQKDLLFLFQHFK